MKRFGLKSGLVALALAAALPGAIGWAQSAADYQTLASSQFSEPRTIDNGALKVVLQPAGPLQAELASPNQGRRILMIVRGERNPHDKVIPVSVYWSGDSSSKTLPADDHLLGLATLNDRYGGKDHTTVIDVTDQLRALSRIKEIPEPQEPLPPSVTLVYPSDDSHPSSPKIEEVLLVASMTGNSR
jgi:hypothetical protein